MTPHEIIREKVIKLEAALELANPDMPKLLREIHTTLREYPECVTLLAEDEIALVVKGLERQTNYVLITGKTPTKAKAKRVAGITEDDL